MTDLPPANRHTIRSGPWSASILVRGAELCSLKHETAGELLWQAGPAWPRHAPNLFPIVGRLKDDVLRHRGQAYPLTQHGFARDLDFAPIDVAADRCRLRLTDTEATRARYPFAFTLDLDYRLDANGLTVTYLVGNPGDGEMLASVGAHPAFRWPLDLDAPKEAHWVRFDRAEPATLPRLDAGLLAGCVPSPVQGDLLPLNDDLFRADALIFDRLQSSGLVFGGPDLRLRIGWTGFDHLGLWMRPGAGYLCIEPWAGIASTTDFDGEFAEKPGVFRLVPGEHRAFAYTVSLA